MARSIVINPVTRIEGHGKITLQLDDNGAVNNAMFHVTQFRGFEKFCEGRPLTEMPSLMARTCGICPVSHLLAASKACDDLLAVEIPAAARMLRQILNLAQMIQSHALSFFHLTSPDLLLGFDSDPKDRNVFGVLAKHPDLARDGIRLRQIGQTIIELLAGKRIHPAWTVAGGVNSALTPEHRERILAMLPDAMAISRRALALFKKVYPNFREEEQNFGDFPSLYIGLVDEEGNLEHYDGFLRVMNEKGKILQDMVPVHDYQEIIAEAVEPYSFMKFPYYKPKGYPEGMYRVGPLARLNIAKRCGTPLADVELNEFRQIQTGPVSSSFHFHYARLIEILFGIEKIQMLLGDAEILSQNVRARARPNRSEGVGIAEAPRGTLIHHYRIDAHGQVTWANLIIATGHNNLALNKGVLQTAQRFVDGNQIKEGMLNRVEALVRCYDPCLSCATHALGKMPLTIELRSAGGDLVDMVSRA